MSEQLAWLDEVERRANAATPGPWRAEYEDAFNPAEADEADKRDAYWVTGPHYVERVYEGLWFWAEADAEFVAHAREDVPRLCRAVREIYEALQAVVDAERELTLAEEADDMGDPSDEFSPVGRATARLLEAMQQAEIVLKRWERRGDGDD